ncbi:MAG: M20/M25/M40 family metallo-hydrolase [Chloroflexi bacterium]|nr:M20/M25/M40 family metallo-hydrolase [Chloroflexota bacterium]
MNDLYTRPEELLQHLIRFDTTNPPGNEAALIEWVADLLQANGVESTIVSKTPGRANLVARLKGRGEAPPLLLYGHVDVVTTEGQTWTHPPFAAEVHDGYIWGRGALDMKGGDAMMIAAFLRAHAEQRDLRGDLILCLASDEEVGGEAGAKFLVREHPELIGDAAYCLSEFGAFPMDFGGHRFYPIMLTERYVHTLRATIRGPGGHGAQRYLGTAMSKLGRILSRMDGARLPVHITPVVQAMIEAMAAHVGEPMGGALRGLLDPVRTDALLDQLDPRISRVLDSMLHNTVNPTIVSGGSKINVIPSEITLRMDGRVLPGVSPETFEAEVRALIGDDTVELVPDMSEPSTVLGDPDLTHFETLAQVLRDAEPGAVPVPYMVSGATDGRILAQLGIQTYGFLPMNLPADFNFSATIHAADERIPVGAVTFGANAINEAVKRIVG